MKKRRTMDHNTDLIMTFKRLSSKSKAITYESEHEE